MKFKAREPILTTPTVRERLNNQHKNDKPRPSVSLGDYVPSSIFTPEDNFSLRWIFDSIKKTLTRRGRKDV